MILLIAFIIVTFVLLIDALTGLSLVDSYADFLNNFFGLQSSEELGMKHEMRKAEMTEADKKHDRYFMFFFMFIYMVISYYLFNL